MARVELLLRNPADHTVGRDHVAANSAADAKATSPSSGLAAAEEIDRQLWQQGL
jgi:hypothetical protein